MHDSILDLHRDCNLNLKQKSNTYFSCCWQQRGLFEMLIQSDMISFDSSFEKHVQIDVLGGRSTQNKFQNTDVVFYSADLVDKQ